MVNPKKGQGVKRTRVTWSPPPGFSTDEVPAPFYVGTLETEDGDIDCSNGAVKA